MDRPKFTHEARCLVVLAGGVLERWIENRARELAVSRAATKIGPEDIEKVVVEFLGKELSDLPGLIEKATDDYKRRLREAA